MSNSVVVVELWRDYSNPNFSNSAIINLQLYAVQSLVTAGFPLYLFLPHTSIRLDGKNNSHF